jgi:methionyl-tRNA synthetase
VGEDLRAQATALPTALDQAVARYDLRSACAAIVALAEAGNRFIEVEAPWQLAKKAEAGDAWAARRFEAVIDAVLTACRAAADELRPFLPDGAARLAAQLASVETNPAPVFPRITVGQTTT